MHESVQTVFFSYKTALVKKTRGAASIMAATQWAKRRRYNFETKSDVSRNDVVTMLKMQIVLTSIARRC